jgi:hypothetical protein
VAKLTDADILNNSLALQPGLGPKWKNAYARINCLTIFLDSKTPLKPYLTDGSSPAPRQKSGSTSSAASTCPETKGALYVSTKADVGFINVVGHELYHDLKV